ncbi:hypothetical protein ESA_01366 [Cronobacter sakazakii ATCC BAA-894]|uniref:Uncharacterized protein n=1 Tax=Cronobacter sakazakii (strain ATCC BAA-894) TaxID=290339 RepID=A7MEC6_CROS8|nr:hypothetical protein ESA_01366 [Cronobacter sakazakii ATCC BAA-894]CCK03018.1 hypothetical protein BN129_1613 [Cronobacter sakazakii 701]
MPFEKCGGEMRMRVQTLAGGFADQHAPFVIKADDARRETFAQRVSDKPRIALLPDGSEAIGGTEIDADDHPALPLQVCERR